jgi:dihydrofolate synthase/folylpolyglutamate synthase
VGHLELEQGVKYLKSFEGWRGNKEFSLSPIRRVLEELGNPHEELEIFHVAGTNGKGSVSVAISALLGEAGKSVFTTISPHLCSAKERLLLDGVPLSNEDFNLLSYLVGNAASRSEIKLSFYEAITAMAFLGANLAKVDYLVLEVGLGGRLDSTNVISRSLISVVTSIGWDHVEILGPTLKDIAREKAGIIKVKGKVVLGALESECRDPILKIAMEKDAEVSVAGEDFYFNARVKKNEFYYQEKGSSIGYWYKSNLYGEHQAHNLSLAIESVRQVNFEVTTLLPALERVHWPGRLEWVDQNILLDCAHNPPGFLSLFKYLKESVTKPFDYIVFGTLKTKAWEESFKELIKWGKEFLLLTPKSPMAEENEKIKLALGGKAHKDFKEEYSKVAEIISNSSYQTLVVGSMYMVGELRHYLVRDQKPLWGRRIL